MPKLIRAEVNEILRNLCRSSPVPKFGYSKKMIRQHHEVEAQSVPFCLLIVLIRLFSSPFINGNFMIINFA